MTLLVTPVQPRNQQVGSQTPAGVDTQKSYTEPIFALGSRRVRQLIDGKRTATMADRLPEGGAGTANVTRATDPGRARLQTVLHSYFPGAELSRADGALAPDDTVELPDGRTLPVSQVVANDDYTLYERLLIGAAMLEVIEKASAAKRDLTAARGYFSNHPNPTPENFSERLATFEEAVLAKIGPTATLGRSSRDVIYTAAMVTLYSEQELASAFKERKLDGKYVSNLHVGAEPGTTEVIGTPADMHRRPYHRPRDVDHEAYVGWLRAGDEATFVRKGLLGDLVTAFARGLDAAGNHRFWSHAHGALTFRLDERDPTRGVLVRADGGTLAGHYALDDIHRMISGGPKADGGLYAIPGDAFQVRLDEGPAVKILSAPWKLLELVFFGDDDEAVGRPVQSGQRWDPQNRWWLQP